MSKAENRHSAVPLESGRYHVIWFLYVRVPCDTSHHSAAAQSEGARAVVEAGFVRLRSSEEGHRLKARRGLASLPRPRRSAEAVRRVGLGWERGGC